MEWILDIALVVLLTATLFHAVRLERALGVLKRDRAALETLVATFNASTRAAETGVERLRGATDGAGRQIQRQIDTATGLKDDLTFLVQRGEGLADRLDELVCAARPLTARAGPSPEVSASISAIPPRSPYLQPPRQTEHEAAEDPRSRSQAERDLLKALRMAR
ncbi:MAG: hypothetical protein EXR07_12265 [Acetobacteraceae bacterium]|nr:hypothetical protein [Acetobacteraceae bacterium]